MKAAAAASDLKVVEGFLPDGAAKKGIKGAGGGPVLDAGGGVCAEHFGWA